MDSSASVFRMSMSSVPWTSSLGLSAIKTLPPGYQEEHTTLLLIVKGTAWGKFMLAAELSGERRWNLVYAARTRIRKNYAATLGEPIRREAAAGACFSVNHAATSSGSKRTDPEMRNDGILPLAA